MLTIYEGFPSRETSTGQQPWIETRWVILGSSDDQFVRQALAGATPTVFSNLLRESLHLKEVAPEVWEGTVRYSALKEPEKGDWKWEFDTTGGTKKITQSLENIHNYAPPGKTAPNFKGAIGVTDDSVEGCEIVVPQFKWTETHQLDAAVVTWDYSQVLYELTGTTNAAPFRGFGEKQVLFFGGKGSRSAKNPDLVEISYSFAASLDVADQVVGDITGIAKKAWEYLWVRHSTMQDAVAKKLVKRPTSAHVERVYESGDFSQLGIGG